MEKNIPERRYQELICHLKILSSNADNKNDKKQATTYFFLAKKLEDIREQRHLSLIGSKDKKKEKYQKILELLNNDLNIEQLAQVISRKFEGEGNKVNKTKDEGR